MSPRQILSNYWFGLQGALFPALEEQLGSLPERYQSFVTVLEVGLRAITEVEEGGGGPDWQLDPSRKYGGVTFDLNDPVGPSMVDHVPE